MYSLHPVNHEALKVISGWSQGSDYDRCGCVWCKHRKGPLPILKVEWVSIQNSSVNCEARSETEQFWFSICRSDRDFQNWIADEKRGYSQYLEQNTEDRSCNSEGLAHNKAFVRPVLEYMQAHQVLRLVRGDPAENSIWQRCQRTPCVDGTLATLKIPLYSPDIKLKL